MGAATIKYISPTQCVWLWVSDNEDQAEFAREPWNMEFRPIRTPEQIAAHERSRYCDRIYGVMRKAASPYNRSDMAEVLYDAGLRFTE